MPLIPLAVALLIVFALVGALPLLLVLRYRFGTSRRLGRGWVARLNLVMMSLSAGLFLVSAAIVNFWIPATFKYSVAGLIAGGILGLLGLAVTHWEQTPQALHYTPNRWLVLIITVAVISRLLYGFRRSWHAWGATAAGPDTSGLAASGISGSLAVGAIVLGYYLIYSAGVWRRLIRYRNPTQGVTRCD